MIHEAGRCPTLYAPKVLAMISPHSLPLYLLLLLFHCSESFSSLELSSLWYPRKNIHTTRFRHNNIHSTNAQSIEHDISTIRFIGNDIGTNLRQQQKNISSNVYKDDEGILSALFGSSNTRDDFFKHVFGRRAAYYPRDEYGAAMNRCHLQQQSELLKPPISEIDLHSLYETNEWTSLRKRGSQDMLDKSKMSYDDLSEYISEGGSIVIPVTPDDYLYPTKQRIDGALDVKDKMGTSMNIYHSGPSAVALNIHYDAYPVLVLQIQGNKEWLIQNGEFGKHERDVNSWMNITMCPGDLLYLPQGVLHAATTAQGYNTTTHVTIGLV